MTSPYPHRRSVLALLAAASVAACAPVAPLNVLSSRSTYTLTDGVAYGKHDRQRLDVYTPVVAAPIGGWPVAVFFYGGTWNGGDRRNYRFVGEALASRGVLTLIVDHRVHPEVKYPAFLEDSALAVAYALKEAKRLGGNGRRVYAVGHSEGAYNAAMIALDPRWLKAVGATPDALAGWVGLAGTYDFYPIERTELQPVFDHPNYPRDSQPIPFVTARAPRTFLGAPYKDSHADPDRNTIALAEKLKDAGVPVQLRIYKRVGHATMAASLAGPLRWLAPVLDDVATFIDTGRPARRPMPG